MIKDYGKNACHSKLEGYQLTSTSLGCGERLTITQTLSAELLTLFVDQYRRCALPLCDFWMIDLKKIKIEIVDFSEEFDMECSFKMNDLATSVNDQFVLTLKLYFSNETNCAITSNSYDDSSSCKVQKSLCVREGIFPSHSKCAVIGEMLYFAMREESFKKKSAIHNENWENLGVNTFELKAKFIDSLMILQQLGSYVQKVSSQLFPRVRDKVFDVITDYGATWYPKKVESQIKIEAHRHQVPQVEFRNNENRLPEEQNIIFNQGRKDRLQVQIFDDYSFFSQNPQPLEPLQPFEPLLPFESTIIPYTPTVRSNEITLKSNQRQTNRRDPSTQISKSKKDNEALQPIKSVKQTSSLNKPQGTVQPLFKKSETSLQNSVVSRNVYSSLQDSFDYEIQDLGSIYNKREKKSSKKTTEEYSPLYVDSKMTISVFLQEQLVQIPPSLSLEDEIRKIQTYGKLRGRVTSLVSRNLIVAQSQRPEILPTDVLTRIASIFLDEIFKESNTEINVASAREALKSFEKVSRSWWKACSDLVAYYELTKLPKDFASKIGFFPVDIRKSIEGLALKHSQSLGIFYFDTTVLGPAIPSEDAEASILPDYSGLHFIYDSLKPQSYPYAGFDVEYFQHPEFGWATALIDFITWPMIENFACLYIEDTHKKSALAIPYVYSESEIEGKGIYILQQFRVSKSNKEWWLLVDKPLDCSLKTRMICVLHDYEKGASFEDVKKITDSADCILDRRAISKNYLEWLNNFLSGQVCEDIALYDEENIAIVSENRVKHYAK